jgi:hypothetical protein
MNRRFLVVPFILLPLGAATFGARSQDKNPNKPAASEEKRPEFIDITWATLLHNDATGKGQAKQIKVVDGDTNITGDLGSWDQKGKTAEAPGHLLMTDPKADATGQKVVIYYKKSRRLLVLTGSVEITVKPKKENPAPGGPKPAALQEKSTGGEAEEDREDSPRKYPAVITCDKLEYEYAKDKKHAMLTGRFKVVQKLPDKTRTLTAEHAEWFGLEERIDLHPPVHWEDTKGEKGDTKYLVKVYTTEGDERLESTGTGSITVPVEEEDQPPKAPEKKPAPRKGT